MLSVDLNVAFAADLSGRWCPVESGENGCLCCCRFRGGFCGRWCPVESGENGCLNADASAAACVDADVLLE